MIRLLKLLRLTHAWKFVKEVLGSTSSIDYNNLNLIMLLFALTLFSHWMACLWRLVPRMEESGENWLTNYEYSNEDGNLVLLLKAYIASLYWSVMTFTTIGTTPEPSTLNPKP